MDWAHCRRKDSLPSSFSSAGLDRKAVSTRIDGISGARKTAKLGFVHPAFVQVVEPAQFFKHQVAEFAAVAQCGGLRHVEQGSIDIAVAAGRYAADRVGIILGLFQEFGGRCWLRLWCSTYKPLCRARRGW